MKKINYTRFQFLLVRLKARRNYRCVAAFRISIPTGTIKRDMATKDLASKI